MIRLYAFVGGLHGALPTGLETVALDPIRAVVGPDVDDAERQALAVQSLLDAADAVLPARYGERFADGEALSAAVAARLPDLTRLLVGVEGCVELVVRASRIGGTERRAGDGASYMRARLRQVTAADELHALLQPLARRAVLAATGLVHDASYLVEREAVDEFAVCVRAYASAHSDLCVEWSGPWAPATFAEAA